METNLLLQSDTYFKQGYRMNRLNKKNIITTVSLALLLYGNTKAITISPETAGCITFATSITSAISFGTVLASHCEMPQIIAGAAGVVVGGGLIPWFVFSKTPSARLEQAKKLLNKLCKESLIQQDPADTESFYNFIKTRYACHSWPLIAAKNELTKYCGQLSDAHNNLEKAIAKERQRNRELLNGDVILNQVYSIWVRVSSLLNLINEHPDYLKSINDYKNYVAMQDIALAVLFAR